MCNRRPETATGYAHRVTHTLETLRHDHRGYRDLSIENTILTEHGWIVLFRVQKDDYTWEQRVACFRQDRKGHISKPWDMIA